MLYPCITFGIQFNSLATYLGYKVVLPSIENLTMPTMLCHFKVIADRHRDRHPQYSGIATASPLN